MIRALHTAANGMEAQQLNIDVIANNLANVNTTGFKKSRANFQDLIYQNVRLAGTDSSDSTQNPAGIQVGLGVKPASVHKLHTVGDMEQTQNPLDIAIEGDGFFAVTRPNGETAYTRAGAFHKDSDGRIVTAEGYPLAPEIIIPEGARDLVISEDGIISAFVDGSTEPTQLGQIEISTFSNPNGLIALGRNLLAESGASGAAINVVPGEDGTGTVLQGFLESSNVSIMEEMVRMISGQRAYEINSKAIKTADEMLQAVSSLA